VTITHHKWHVTNRHEQHLLKQSTAHNVQLVRSAVCKITSRVIITTMGGTKEMMMGNWLILLFRRTHRLSYCNFFNVCTHRSEFHQQASFTVAEGASHQFAHCSLQLQFVLALLPTVTI